MPECITSHYKHRLYFMTDLNVGFVALRDTGHICICILIDPMFNFFTDENGKTDIRFKATDICLSHTPDHNISRTHTHKHRNKHLQLHPTRQAATEIQTHPSLPHTQHHSVTACVDTSLPAQSWRGDRCVRAQKPRFSAVWVKLLLRRIQFISNTNNTD